MPLLRRLRMLIAFFIVIVTWGCGSGSDLPIAPTPPAPGTVEMPKAGAGVVSPEEEGAMTFGPN